MLAHDGSPTLNIGNVKVDVGMKRGLCTVAVYLDGSITAYRIARLVSPAAPPEDQFTKQWTDYLKANNPGGALQGDFFARCFAAVIFCMESREWSDGVVDRQMGARLAESKSGSHSTQCNGLRPNSARPGPAAVQLNMRNFNREVSVAVMRIWYDQLDVRPPADLSQGYRLDQGQVSALLRDELGDGILGTIRDRLRFDDILVERDPGRKPKQLIVNINRVRTGASVHDLPGRARDRF
ncbi:hypothetical protein ONS95_012797 [Cadophora gregata]|uniref:uncharacterized protein n=1 Tax=Cadophora gregata TaxID=51156 RepID=UPI0026DC41F6|nr:uncharacterized protein ONS95_012797 [Cadophora gregata]KAK0115744.1 hypothetical protein ONS95_012797 [Cadophora gregata]